MTDPRFIPPSERDTLMQCSDEDNMRIVEILGGSVTAYEAELEGHAAFMDERDARQRDLIQRLADRLNCPYIRKGTMPGECDCAACELVAEARGIEATNE